MVYRISWDCNIYFKIIYRISWHKQVGRIKYISCVVLMFYGRSTLFMSFLARSVNLSDTPHCSWASLQSSLSKLSAHSFASNRQQPLNQRKGENGRRNNFMTSLHERLLPDLRIEPAIDCRPKMTLLPPLGNFADIVYLKEQSFLHRIRDVCTL